MTTGTCHSDGFRHSVQTPAVLIVLFILSTTALFAFSPALMAETGQAAGESQGIGLRISSVDSEFDVKESSYEFIDNVIITFGPTRITADNVKVWSRDNSGIDSDQEPTSLENTVKKIIATGNVTIDGEFGVVNADEAVYDSETKTLTLKGDPATFNLVENNSNFHFESRNCTLRNIDL